VILSFLAVFWVAISITKAKNKDCIHWQFKKMTRSMLVQAKVAVEEKDMEYRPPSVAYHGLHAVKANG
jgi:hypothetical protein